MKLFWIIAAAGLVAVGGALGGASELDRWNDCLASLESVQATHQARLPAAVRELSASLWSMEQGVSVLRDNFRTTQRWMASAGPGAPGRHLVENGVLSCERLKTRFEASSHSFFFFMASLGCLILVLTARVGLAMVPATPRRPVHAEAVVSPPSDRSVSGRR